MGNDYRRGDDSPRGKDDFDFRKDEYKSGGAPKRDDAGGSGGGDGGGGGGGDDCGSQVIGWIVMLAIFGGINLITMQFGFYIIPFPRR